MSDPARRVRFQGTGEYRDEAEPLLLAAGDIAGVVRGRPRSLLIKCPDGCGDTLVINLDPRAGKAWQLIERRNSMTLYPSVWREDGCRSHFIIWRDHLLWCGRFELDNVEPEYDPGLEGRVFAETSEGLARTAHEIAATLDEITWEVSRVLRRLVRLHLVEEEEGKVRGRYRRRAGVPSTLVT